MCTSIIFKIKITITILYIYIYLLIDNYKNLFPGSKIPSRLDVEKKISNEMCMISKLPKTRHLDALFKVYV